MIKNCQEVFANKINLSSYDEEYRPIKPTYIISLNINQIE